MPFNPIRTGGGEIGIPTVCCPLLKKSSDNPYLKFQDFSQHLVSDTPMIFVPKNLVYTQSQHFLDTQYKNNLIFFLFIKRIF